MCAVGLKLRQLRVQASTRVVGVGSRAVLRADAAKTRLREQLPEQRGLERVLPEEAAVDRLRDRLQIGKAISAAGPPQKYSDIYFHFPRIRVLPRQEMYPSRLYDWSSIQLEFVLVP